MKLHVLVVGLCSGTRELLERRIGGVLGEMAWVRSATPDEAAGRRPVPDVVVTMAHSQVAGGVRQRLEAVHGLSGPVASGPVAAAVDDLLAGGRTRMVAVELTLLPSAVVTLSRLPADRPVGVVCHHRTCANAFMAEVIRSGVTGQRLSSGGFSEMAVMDVGCFVCPEDVAREARVHAAGRPVVTAPRGISPYSAAELIQTVLMINRERQQRLGAAGA